MKIYSSAQIRAIEAQFLAQGLPLMARAGAAAAQQAQHWLRPNGGPVWVFCGPGNNGGDGLVTARLLRQQGHAVQVILPAQRPSPPADAAAALADWQQAGGAIQHHLPSAAELAGAALIVDAILGLGSARAVQGELADWVATINQAQAAGCPVLALDLPTGLHADTGQVLGLAVRATATLGFIGSKIGLHTAAGCDHAGRVQVADLGLNLATQTAAAELNHPALFAAALRPRPANSHKGDYGNARIIGGAAGMVGAALLAARAALYMGAGRCYVGLLDAAAPTVDCTQPELMLQSPDAVLGRSGAACLGPGLGQSAAATALLTQALAQSHPLLLDADALNLLASQPQCQSLLQARAAAGHATVLTPHEAEAGRLLGCPYSAVHADRYAAAQELAQRYQAVVVLKGCGSIIAVPTGQAFINPTGGPALATAGSGDVLCGLITGLLAQTGTGADAALACTLAGVYIHGLAADRLGLQRGLTASELIPAARLSLHRLLPAPAPRGAEGETWA